MKVVRSWDEQRSAFLVTASVTDEEIQALDLQTRKTVIDLMLTETNMNQIKALTIIERASQSKAFVEKVKDDKGTRRVMWAIWALLFIVGLSIAFIFMFNGHKVIAMIVGGITGWLGSVYLNKFKLL